MKNLYNDQFLAGAPGGVVYFAASISEHEKEFNHVPEELDLEIGSIANGLGLYWDLNKDDERQEALMILRKLTDGFKNLLAAVERRNNDRRLDF